MRLMGSKLLVAAAALSFLVSSAAVAAETPAEEAVRLAEKVQAHYDGVRDLKATFIQTYFKALTSRSNEKDGELFMKKPGKVLYKYTTQNTMTYLNGDVLWYYKPDERTAAQTRVDRKQMTAAFQFLTGEGKLTDAFKVEPLSSDPALKLRPGLVALKLTPKGKEPTYARLILGVDPKTGSVMTTILELNSGDTNRFDFKKVETNSGLQDELFEFVPPKGVDVERM